MMNLTLIKKRKPTPTATVPRFLLFTLMLVLSMLPSSCSFSFQAASLLLQSKRLTSGSSGRTSISLGIAAPVTLARQQLQMQKQKQHQQRQRQQWTSLSSSTADNDLDTTSNNADTDPQVWSSGYSSKNDLLAALQEATELALEGLPPNNSNSNNNNSNYIDLAIVTISSLYDGQSSPSIVVPTVLAASSSPLLSNSKTIQHLVGCTTGGIISSTLSKQYGIDPSISAACRGIESEGIPGVAIVFGMLPKVQLKTFHVVGDDVPDDVGRVNPIEWKRLVGLSDFASDVENDKPSFFVIPSPSFQNELDDLLQGLAYSFPHSTIFGGVASTVSSLSRARLFRYDATSPATVPTTLTDGCIGVGMMGDIEVKTMVAQGTKPVGGIYRVVTGQDSTIRAIVLDEAATLEAQEYDQEQSEDEEENDDDDDEDDGDDDVATKNARMAAAYAKAAIPKPPLAEANFIMRTLSDDDQAFMRKAILVGLERGGSIGRTPNELARLADGKGHRFTVHQVASAGMKDGSVTLPLGALQVEPGTRVRFFVREADFSKKEVQALWTGYKKATLEETMARMTNDESSEQKQPFEPAMCLLMSTLDRGAKFFGKTYETNAISKFAPSVPCVGGFFANGVLGKLDANSELDIMVHGSASTFILFGSASRRPIYIASKAAAEKAKEDTEDEDDSTTDTSTTDATATAPPLTSTVQDEEAPRAPNGELILKRREVHSGRALSVATVEWSVADNMAKPTSTLELFLWEKETQVDRLRERVPLANLVSQCRLSNADPSMPKPRDWIGPILRRVQEEGFAVIPECKRSEPVSGSLRKRYNIAKLTKSFVTAGVPAMAVNCDSVLFGGALEDITTAREAAAAAAMELATEDGMEVPPILASDLIIYPYQLYKLRLAGTDAVNLMGGALASKDLIYLTKIAASLQIQTVVTVTSTVQIEALLKLSPGSIHGLICSNRELEDFSFDMTGQQALGLLHSPALELFRAHHADAPVLVEGRVGLIERRTIEDSGSASGISYTAYLQEVKDAGAVGVIVGGGLAKEHFNLLEKSILSSSSNSVA